MEEKRKIKKVKNGYEIWWWREYRELEEVEEEVLGDMCACLMGI